MIEFIIKNKDWLFSGAGFFVIAWVKKKLSKESESGSTTANSGPHSAVRVEVVQTQSPATSGIKPDSEVAGIIMRFNLALDLLNEKRESSKYSVARLAQLMELQSVGELECVFAGECGPSFKLIDNFCATLGISRKWVAEGIGTPFGVYDDAPFDPLACLAEAEESRPDRIYFIRSSSERGETFVLFKMSDHKYRVASQSWHISDHVGAGGRSQIFGLYQLITQLNERRLGAICGGRILPQDTFSKLFGGHVFPGSVMEFPSLENSWWDDFIDIDHVYPISASYKSMYGEGFMFAQSVVRDQLKEDAERQNPSSLLASTSSARGAPVAVAGMAAKADRGTP